MRTQPLALTPIGGWLTRDASGETDATRPHGDEAKPTGPAAGEVPATTPGAPPPSRAVVHVDGVRAYAGPSDIALFYMRRWSAEHPEKNVTIAEDDS